MSSSAANADVLIRIMAEVEKAKANVRSIRKEVENMAKPNVRSYERIARAQKVVQDQTQKLQRTTAGLGGQFKRNEGRFQGWALSVMFFGMAMQRVFSDIWKQSAATFNDVSHSVAGTVTGFDLLEGSITYLQYSIGAALEPVVMQLVPIIDKITEWVQENEALTAGIVKWGFIIGSVLFMVGFLTLAFNGVWTMIKNVTTAIKFLSANPLILMAVAAILVFTWLYKIKTEMGTWSNFFMAILRGIIRAFVITGAAIAGAFGAAWNFVQQGWNNVVEWIGKGINKIIDWLNFVIRMINSLTGSSINPLDNIDVSGFMAEVTSAGNAFWNAFDAVMNPYLAWEAAHLAIDSSQLSGTAATLASSPSANSGGSTANTQVTNFNNITIEAGGLTFDEIIAGYEQRVNSVQSPTAGN